VHTMVDAMKSTLISYGASAVVLTGAQELAVTLVVIVSLLVLLTICFELLKMWALACTTKYTQYVSC
jgi:hypothetical protein